MLYQTKNSNQHVFNFVLILMQLCIHTGVFNANLKYLTGTLQGCQTILFCYIKPKLSHSIMVKDKNNFSTFIHRQYEIFQFEWYM